jgi:hypothetical protein
VFDTGTDRLLSTLLVVGTALVQGQIPVGVTGVALGPSIERRLASLHTSRRYVLAHRLRQRY